MDQHQCNRQRKEQKEASKPNPEAHHDMSIGLGDTQGNSATVLGGCAAAVVKGRVPIYRFLDVKYAFNHRK